MSDQILQITQTKKGTKGTNLGRLLPLSIIFLTFHCIAQFPHYNGTVENCKVTT